MQEIVLDEIKRLLERQSRWQSARRNLPWPEKLRLVVALRESVQELRSAPVATANQEKPPRRSGDGDQRR